MDTVTQVLGGFIRYFQAECTTFSDTVVVELMDTTGTNYLYCSTVETNPGPLTDSTTADETMGVSTRTCTVDLSSASRRVSMRLVSFAQHVPRDHSMQYRDHLHTGSTLWVLTWYTFVMRVLSFSLVPRLPFQLSVGFPYRKRRKAGRKAGREAGRKAGREAGREPGNEASFHPCYSSL